MSRFAQQKNHRDTKSKRDHERTAKAEAVSRLGQRSLDKRARLFSLRSQVKTGAKRDRAAGCNRHRLANRVDALHPNHELAGAMKNFFSTLAAILVAAAVIFGIKACGDSMNHLAQMRRETAIMKQQAEARKKEAQFYEDLTISRMKAMIGGPSPTPNR
jgi:hypothetical protein